MSLDSIIQKIIAKRPSFKKIYLDHDVHVEVSNLITAARIHGGFSQKDLAKLIKTQQPSIARLESGKFLPNVGFLDKIAKALGTYLIIKFGFMDKADTVTQNVLPESTVTESVVGTGVAYTKRYSNLTVDDLINGHSILKLKAIKK
ncbi:MAG: hypothetical protein A3G49_01280 [Candidatus Sungbacteria bacterium RIFCSPLOWO2_12_FULL_41_11]|uniref:HTH cro/C1-type domain-containing protein n=1 Tax=Candidatus Sungbacteria bacterium RIFCSPLOWO2_12_FULL_41_11 TaxID=1802286 RepID=A0A1G2LNS5_9BACT|nr:MAG: Transcriptional regulator, XRE family [Parcubacteria group bacterium GW2011_GWA2_42_14]OGZ97388.1 MAG: hypothetical protein A3D41_05465 [Candidatus Sungbacteria bacterium RIFCSPHIGHO2_02_FULL_41_12b]OHA13266.1 MAG: hypothetical protein A3G49_01280 [Candidatus Sungbacteria bacterium RIFCSPLOWO2_12_FULL_41_11]